MQDVLLGAVDLPEEVKLAPEKGEIVVSPGEIAEVRLKIEGGRIEGDVVVSGDLKEGEGVGDELILKLEAPKSPGSYILQVSWSAGEVILPLHVKEEYVVIERVEVEEDDVRVKLIGPKNKKIRGELTIEGLKGGKSTLLWRRRVAVKGEIDLSIAIPNVGAHEKLFLRFKKGEMKVEEVVPLKKEMKAEEEEPEEVVEAEEKEAPQRVVEKAVRERRAVRLRGVIRVPAAAGVGGLFPSEKVERVVKVDGCTIKILSSPALIIEGENPLPALTALLYTSESQMRRWEETKRWAEILKGLYPPGSGDEAKKRLEEVKKLVLKALEGDEEGERGLSEAVEDELKTLKELKSIGEGELHKWAGGWLNCIEGSLANALSLLKKGANVDAIAEAVSSEILASIFSLKMLFLWERGLYEEYPGLKTEERKLIKGCVQSSEMVLRRLAHVVGSSREILRLNRENRPIREALMALRELKVELRGVDGEFKEDDKVRGEILLKGDGERSINLFLSFRTPSHVVVLKPPVSYSEGILKSDVFEVKGEKRVPLHLEILKGVPSEEATIEVSIHPLLPPLKREIPYGGGEG